VYFSCLLVSSTDGLLRVPVCACVCLRVLVCACVCNEQELFEQRAIPALTGCNGMVSPIIDFLHEVSRYTDMARNFRQKMCQGIQDGLQSLGGSGPTVSASVDGGAGGAGADAPSKRLRT
jgi:hypothetical protein